MFLRESHPRDLVSIFIDAVKNHATQSEAQKKMKFLQVEIIIQNKLAQNLELLINIPLIELTSTRTLSQMILTLCQHSF